LHPVGLRQCDSLGDELRFVVELQRRTGLEGFSFLLQNTKRNQQQSQ
jgi:hypothetical protein